MTVEREKPHVLTDLRDGLRFVLRTPWLRWTLLFASTWVFLALGPIEVLLPFIARDRFADGEQVYGLMLARVRGGQCAGRWRVSSRPLPRRYLTVMMAMWGVGSLPLVIVGTTSSLPVMLVALFVIGLADGAGMVIWGTLLQRRVPPEMLGRVSSLDFFVSLAFMPVSMAVAGPLSKVVPVETHLRRGRYRAGATGRGRARRGAHAARRDRPPAALVLDAEHRRQCQHHDQPPHHVGQHRCQHAAGGSAFHAHTVPRMIAAKPSIGLPLAHVATV